MQRGRRQDFRRLGDQGSEQQDDGLEHGMLPRITARLIHANRLLLLVIMSSLLAQKLQWWRVLQNDLPRANVDLEMSAADKTVAFYHICNFEARPWPQLLSRRQDQCF